MYASTKQNRLSYLAGAGVPITDIVDVGVQRGTPELIQLFPDRKHWLFEPAKSFHAAIDVNYRHIRRSLVDCACSDTNGTLWLVEIAIHKDGVPSHAFLSKTQCEVDGSSTLSCAPVPMRRLDSFSQEFAKNYLLKIDVDGAELKVVAGSAGCIAAASIVVIEAVWSELAQRALAVQDFGFTLFDIVDRVVYGEAFWQCDLLFVRNDLVSPAMRPSGDFDVRLWKELV